MKIKKIKILNLRNHQATEFELSPHTNVFYGLNGAGKTTILESVAIGAFSRSFQVVEDATVVRFGEEHSFVRIDGISDLDVPYFVSVFNEKKQRKKIKNSIGDNLNPKDIIGRLPIVVLSPDLKAITAGSPADRRKFINQVLAQTSVLYSADMLNLRRCLKQRNKLLSQAKFSGHCDMQQLEVLTDMFIALNTNLVMRRNAFIEIFTPYYQASYADISLGREEVALIYEPDTVKMALADGKEAVTRAYYEKADKVLEQELRRGTTLFGSQKDELLMLINGNPVKETASQGQHKTILISMKFAEFRFIKEELDETPVVLLDDVFAELDSNRSRNVVDFIRQNDAQSLITITNPARLESFDNNDSNRYFFVEDGKVTTNE